MKRAALVTGATRRIGLAIATRLTYAGFDVALHASPRSQKQCEREAAQLSRDGSKTCVVVGDLANPSICSKLIDQAAQTIGPLTLLVNNASVFEPDNVNAIEIDRWDRHFAVNLRAPVILTTRFAAQARPGASIVNVVDQRVLNPTPVYFSYTLTKSALWTATQTMAQALAERGIRVNAVGPGPVLPNTNEGDAAFREEVENVPLRHAVTPEDVADSVLYLAEASSVTGQLIAVDAGQHLAWRTCDIQR